MACQLTLRYPNVAEMLAAHCSDAWQRTCRSLANLCGFTLVHDLPRLDSLLCAELHAVSRLS